MFGSIVVAVLTTLHATPLADQKESAEAEFQLGVRHKDDLAAARPHFAAAAADFEAIRAAEVESPALVRNLANSYLLSGNVPKAIQEYRRGLRRWPHDRALESGLQAARTQLTFADADEFGKWIEPSRPWSEDLADNLLSWVVVVFIASVACLASVHAWRTRQLNWCLATATLTVLASLGIATLVIGSMDTSAGRYAIVARSDAILRRGDGLAYPPRYSLPLTPGVEGRVVTERGEWLQIELTSTAEVGPIGWLPRGQVLLDVE